MNFGEIIRGWYEKNKRDLPWRGTTDPYRIWLSEVILQQTRVDQGLGYYLRFVDAFPDVAALAAAGEDRVLKLWQGLGYYSRARNLHRAAREIAGSGGRFPDTYEGLLGLPGVGPYTAAAVASICFGEARAVVDGNVARVVSRLHGVEEVVNAQPGSRMVADLATSMLDSGGEAVAVDPGLHNQAMMEFGALVCVPSGPDCAACPVRAGCSAYLNGRVEQIPVKKPKKKPVDRWMYFYIVSNGDRVLLSQRGTDNIWRSLYQFPAHESASPLPEEAIPDTLWQVLGMNPKQPAGGPGGGTAANRPFKVTVRRISGAVRHQLTHRTIHARFIHVWMDPFPGFPTEPPGPGGIFAAPLEKLDTFPVPRIIDRYLESHRPV